MNPEQGVEGAANYWNTRPIEDELRARAEKAEAMIDKLIDAGNDLYMASLPDGCGIGDSPDGEWAAWDEAAGEAGDFAAIIPDSLADKGGGR